jgi:hypothetical protein
MLGPRPLYSSPNKNFLIYKVNSSALKAKALMSLEKISFIREPLGCLMEEDRFELSYL